MCAGNAREGASHTRAGLIGREGASGMERPLERTHSMARAATCAVLALLLALAMALAPGQAHADEADDVSFYKITSVASASFEKAISEDKVPVVSNPGDAGGYTSFIASDLQDVPVIGFLAAQVTNGSATQSFNAFKQRDEAAVAVSNGGWNDNFSHYGHYGYMLSQLGYDATVNDGLGSIFSVIWHGLSGAILLGVYFLSEIVSVIMSALIWVMKFFNPFAIFAGGVDSAFSNSGMMSSAELANTPYADIADSLSGVYKSMQNVAWTLIMPLFMVSMIVTLLLILRRRATNVRGGDDGMGGLLRKVKSFVVRAMFIVLGIPLLGGLYTMSLEAMYNEMSFSNLNADSLVASQFVDFEHWASNTNLQVPQDATLALQPDAISDSTQVLAGDLTSDTLTSTRENAFLINKTAGIYGSLASHTGGLTDTTTSYGDGSISSQQESNFQTSMSLIMRYMTSDTYDSTDYESGVKAGALNKIPAGVVPGDNDGDTAGSGKALKAYLDALAKSSSYDNGTLDLTGDTKADTVNGYLNWFGNGNLNAQRTNGGGWIYYGDSGLGLSTIATYNYLNAEFSAGKVMQFSTVDAMSNMAQVHHMSAPMVGTGFYGLMLWANAVALLLAFAILGIFYCFGMVFSNVKHAISLIMAIPFGLLGVMKSIIKVVTLAIVMVLEVLVTFFAYALMCDLLLFVNDLAINVLPGMFGSALGSFIALHAGVLLSVVALIIFIVVSLKVRKMLIRAMTEAVEGSVDRILGDGSSGGAADAAKKGAAAGALGGLAAGAMMGARGIGGDKARSFRADTPWGEVAYSSGPADGADAPGADSSEDAGALPEGGASQGQGIEGADRQGAGADPAGGSPSAAAGVTADTSDAEAAGAAKLDRMTGATSVSQDDADAEAKSEARKAAVGDTVKHAGAAVAHGVTGDHAGAAMEGAQAAGSVHDAATAGQKVDAARARSNAGAVSAAPAQGGSAAPDPAAVNAPAPTQGKQLTPSSPASKPPAEPPAPVDVPAKVIKTIPKGGI